MKRSTKLALAIAAVVMALMCTVPVPRFHPHGEECPGCWVGGPSNGDWSKYVISEYGFPARFAENSDVTYISSSKKLSPDFAFAFLTDFALVLLISLGAVSLTKSKLPKKHRDKH